MTSVLESTPPRFTAQKAAQVAAELFGVHGTASELGSERDQAFLLDDGGAGGVLKISNSGEDEAVLDLEEAAIAHVTAVDPDLPVARPLARRAALDGHQVRLFEQRHGRKAGPELDDIAVRDVAVVHARLCLALRSFFHPAAGRELFWNLRAAPRLRPLLDDIAEPDRRAARRARRSTGTSNACSRSGRACAPRSCTATSTSTTSCSTSAAGSPASSTSATAATRRSRPTLRSRSPRSCADGRPRTCSEWAGSLWTGSPRSFPLEPLELELLGDLVAARLAAIVSISAWRTRRFPENAAYIEAWDDDSWRLLALFDELGPDAGRARARRASPRGRRRPELARRRTETLGALLTPLTYARPVHAVRAEGVWIYEPDGERLLDAYNNVPVVGHCHPRVTEAIVRQTRLGATPTRAISPQPLVELAERLLATFPPEARFDTVLLVNSGSEANDLAWRLAVATTGTRRRRS